jgi:hypothetical protein
MIRLLTVCLVWASFMGSLEASQPPRGLRPPRAEPVADKTTNPTVPPREEPKPALAEKKEKEKAGNAGEVEAGVTFQWFGHSFVYLISRSGVRVAIDPFSEAIRIPFPARLQADIVLISHEAADRNGAERLFGDPQIYRSVTGLGVNRASGLLFKGVSTFRDDSQGSKLGRSVAFVFEMDGIRFCHLGGMGYPLGAAQRDQIGRVDVLFMPAGNTQLTVAEWVSTARELGARWVVPVMLRNEKAGLDGLRPLSELLESGLPSKKAAGNGFVFTPGGLPAEPTILVIDSP